MEVRGRDIGALMVRRQLNPDSNLCYGEGGAGGLQEQSPLYPLHWKHKSWVVASAGLKPGATKVDVDCAAGTWSDGKLATRIGRNTDPVRHVLQVGRNALPWRPPPADA